jgi:DNA-binding transcriptional LysR family regulator
MRALAASRRILVATPLLATQMEDETDPECLSHIPSLAFASDDAPEVWRLIGPDGSERVLRLTPRLTSGELSVLRAAAVAGLGVALIPDHFCRNELRDGRLVRLLPDWCKQPGLVHIVYTTKRGLTPAVRALIDHLAIGFKEDETMDSPSDFPSRRPTYTAPESLTSEKLP